jgi:hypothetical protein
LSIILFRSNFHDEKIIMCDDVFLFSLSATTVVATSSFYHIGKNLSTRTAQSVWDNLGHNCHEVDTFLKIIGDSTDRTKSTIRSYAQQGHRAVEDFGNGYIVGLTKVFEAVAQHCQSECSKVGKVSGQISAGVFCETSQAIGRTATFRWMEDTPSIICGESYRTSCESKFYDLATEQCPVYANGSAFEKYYRALSGGCCAYNPKDNTIR